MNRTNLIPIYRQLRDARAQRLRGWSWAAGALCALMGVAYAVCALASGQIASPSTEDFVKTASEISQVNQEAVILRKQVAILRDQVQSTEFISQQPDFSLLLALLSSVVDDHVVINECTLLRDASRGQEELKLSGLARTQPDVASFMLRLESTGIFRKVSLVRSSEQPVLATKAAAFQVQCLLGPKSAQEAK